MTGRPYTVLLWNMGIYHARELSEDVERSRVDVLKSLVAWHAPSLVALQEAPDELLQRALGSKYKVISGVDGIATAVDQTAWEVLDHGVTQGWRALVVKIDPLAGGLGLWFWNLHLPILFRDSDERRTLSRCEPRDDLRKFRARDPDRGEMVVGDFNLEPHDVALTGRDGFYARSFREWVLSTASRRDMPYRPLYNATHLASLRTSPPYGSYHRHERNGAGPWSLRDQVLLSAELVRAGEPKVTLVTKAGGRALYHPEHGRPYPKIGSDHLPLLIEFLA